MAGFGLRTITGVITDGESAQWTLLRSNRGEIEIQSRGTMTFDAETPLPGDLASKVEGSLVIAMPARFVLLRIMDLPTVDPAECRSMVELQAGKISPFPVDDLVIGHEVLDAGETSTRVLIITMEKDRIEEAGKPLIEAGMVPETVDVDIMADWYAINAAAESRKGRVAHVIMRGEHASMLVIQDGRPLVMRTLPPLEERTAGDLVAMLAEETDYTLASLESEWGCENATVRLHGPEDAAKMAEAMEAALGVTVQWAPLDDLMDRSEALARRRLERPDCLNLRPDAWREITDMRRVKRKLSKISIDTS